MIIVSCLRRSSGIRTNLGGLMFVNYYYKGKVGYMLF